MKKTILTFCLALVAAINIAGTCFAQVQLDDGYRPDYAVNYTPPAAYANRSDYYINYILQAISGALIYVAGPIAVLIIVWGGGSYVTSGGDETAIGNAKKTIVYAIIGLVVIILSYALIHAIVGIVGGISPTS